MKYIFRGIIVFDYNPDTKQVYIPDGNFQNHFNQCKFIPEDYTLISRFFGEIYKHATGAMKTEDLKNIEVN